MRCALEMRRPAVQGGPWENEAGAIEFPSLQDSRDAAVPQAIPDLIALHIGVAYCARWAEGGAHV